MLFFILTVSYFFFFSFFFNDTATTEIYTLSLHDALPISSWSAIGDAFTTVRWQWVAAAVGLNLASVVARAIAWRTVIRQAIPPPYPSNLLVFSAFSVGLFANAVLPGRIGELARVAVLARKLPKRK